MKLQSKRIFRFNLKGNNGRVASIRQLIRVQNVMKAKSSISCFVLALASISFAQQPSDLVRIAFENRDSVRAARLQVLSAEHTKSSLSAYPLTRLETGDGTRPDIAGGGEDLSLFQPIDIFGKTRVARASGQAGVVSAKATFRQACLDVQTEVLQAYANWINAVRNNQNAEDQLAIAKQMYDATKTRVEVRALPELQLVRADIELEKAKQVSVDRSAAKDSAQIKLQQAIGGEATLQPKNESFGLGQLFAVESKPNMTRPDLLVLQAVAQSAQADASQAKFSLYPDLELQARRSPWSDTGEHYGVRLQFVVPLWDHGAVRNKERAAKAHQASAQAQYSDLMKRAQAEINSANVQIAASKKSVAAYDHLVSASKELLAKTQRGFDLGASTLIDVLDARRSLSDAMDLQSNALLNLDLAIEAGLRAQGHLVVEPK